MKSLNKCKLCGVEFIGALADHDCDRDAWARPTAPAVPPAPDDPRLAHMQEFQS
jgi:hypothetical protein